MKPIPQQLDALLRQAIQAAQDAGALPAFDIPNNLNIAPPKQNQADQADYATPIALASAKAARKKAA